jgi:hypothetical protein
MKDGLCNIGNSWVTAHKKMCYGHIAYKKIKDFSTNVGHVILSMVTTFEIKVFGKIEMYDGIYNCLLCVVIVFFFSKSITYSKEFFS